MQEQQLQLKQSSDELQRQNKELELSKIELNKKAEDLEQSIRNFISNSLKFTHKGYIKFIIEAFQNNIKISVQDTSIGIAKNKQKLIFQAFRQADGSTSRKYGGTGLGLSITKEFVSLLKGEIQIDSKENEGSTFSIVVPNIYTNNRKINKNSITISSLDTINNIDTQIEQTIIQKDDKPFLIIEDNISFANTLKDIINQKGEVALVAHLGKEGLELASKYSNIQGVLLDLGLPDIDGIDVLKSFKSNIATKDIPVYILSGQTDYEHSIDTQAIGFKQKPLNTKDINNIFNEFEKLNKVKNILIIEDDKNKREAVIDLISNNSINSVGTSDINSAIIELNNKDFDAIIIDLVSNDEDMVKLFDYNKNNDSQIPIIIYTDKNISYKEEERLKKYTDSIIIKSDNSQVRLLDEVDMFLHRVKNDKKNEKSKSVIKNNIDFTNKKILVADDDMRNTFVLVEILEQKGAEVLTATNGEESIDILDKKI